MSLWWARKDQLDEHQLKLIEDLPLRENHLVLGPPGSGKTNVLLRRAQYARSQGLSNVLVLTFTRPLTEFVKTGCFDSRGREIFPQSSVNTLESWIRSLYRQHSVALPNEVNDLQEWKALLADGALEFAAANRLPRYDTLFVDEVQDLIPEEVELIQQWGGSLFMVGDDRQKIYGGNGIEVLRGSTMPPLEHELPFHYRLVPELCRMADRILMPTGTAGLQTSAQYVGPKPGRVEFTGPLSRTEQMERAKQRLKDQVRAYADLIDQGDRLAVIVARKNSRQEAFDFLNADPELMGKVQIIRARNSDEGRGFSPSFSPDTPICILSVSGCKGLEFRAVHWLFAEDLAKYHNAEHYYTVVTRAKTSLDVYYTGFLPDTLARSHSTSGGDLWQ